MSNKILIAQLQTMLDRECEIEAVPEKSNAD
jgi:hypothetical protein